MTLPLVCLPNCAAPQRPTGVAMRSCGLRIRAPLPRRWCLICQHSGRPVAAPVAAGTPWQCRGAARRPSRPISADTARVCVLNDTERVLIRVTSRGCATSSPRAVRLYVSVQRAGAAPLCQARPWPQVRNVVLSRRVSALNAAGVACVRWWPVTMECPRKGMSKRVQQRRDALSCRRRLSVPWVLIGDRPPITATPRPIPATVWASVILFSLMMFLQFLSIGLRSDRLCVSALVRLVSPRPPSVTHPASTDGCAVRPSAAVVD
jgi:hypothetical protein